MPSNYWWGCLISCNTMFKENLKKYIMLYNLIHHLSYHMEYHTELWVYIVQIFSQWVLIIYIVCTILLFWAGNLQCTDTFLNERTSSYKDQEDGSESLKSLIFNFFFFFYLFLLECEKMDSELQFYTIRASSHQQTQVYGKMFLKGWGRANVQVIV